METRAERAKRQRETRKQEQGPADARVGRTARTFVHATHPDTGVGVVFLPGELLPDWLELAPEHDAEV